MVARLTSEEAIAWSVQAQPSQSISSKSSSSPQASNSSAQDSSVHMRMAYSMAFGPCWEPPRTECSYAPSEAGTISRMWRRASISTAVSQSRPEPSSAARRASRIVKNSWSRRVTWGGTRLREPPPRGGGKTPTRDAATRRAGPRRSAGHLALDPSPGAHHARAERASRRPARPLGRHLRRGGVSDRAGRRAATRRGGARGARLSRDRGDGGDRARRRASRQRGLRSPRALHRADEPRGRRALRGVPPRRRALPHRPSGGLPLADGRGGNDRGAGPDDRFDPAHRPSR